MKRLIPLIAACALAAFTPADARPFSIGCNYWASNAGVLMWRRWDAACVANDLDVLKAHGMTTLRVFPTWPDFQPITRLSGGTGWLRGYAQKDGPLENEAGVDEEMMRRFRFLCDEAAKRDMKLVVGLVTGWMSGQLFAPSALNGRNLLTDSAAIEWEVKFVRHFVRAMRDHSAIAAWDLGNECNCMANKHGDSATPLTRADAWTWMNAIASAIRLEDGSRPVVSGMHSCSSDVHAPWNLRDMGDLMDVLTTHPYPIYVPLCNREPFDSFRNAMHPAAESLYYEGMSGKPCFVEEAGSLGTNIAPDESAARTLRLGALAARTYGLGGYLWWCAFDQGHFDFTPYDWTALERDLGLFRRGREPKAIALAMRDVRKEIESLGELPPRKVDAVCLVSEWDDAWPQSLGAFLLSVQAGISISFAPAEREWPESRFYIIPAAKGRGGYSGRAWRRLRQKVREGANLIMTRGGGATYSEFEEVTGCRVESMCDAHWTARVALANGDKRTISLSGDMKTEVKAVRARVLAADEKGRPFMTVANYGKGRVAFINCALERIAATGNDCFREENPNPAYLLYSAAADALGMKRLCPEKPPFVSLTAHRGESGNTVLVGVNFSHSDVSIPFRIPAGSAVRTVVYEEDIPIFRHDFAKFSVQNGAKGGWDGRTYRVSVPDKPNFWMHYNAFPGMKPFPGPCELVLRTDASALGPGEMEVSVREFPAGKSRKFKMPFADEVRFAVSLDPSKLYEITAISAYRAKWDGKPWSMRFISLAGRFATSEAGALRVDVDTGDPLRLVKHGSGAKAELTVCNASQGRISAKGVLSMTGFFGDKFDIPVAVDLAGGETRRIGLPAVTRKGVWRIAGNITAGDGSSMQAETRFAVIDRHGITPQQPKGSFRMGINYHMDRYSPGDRRLTLDALTACGAKLVRASIGCKMAAVQPNGPDEWKFDVADENLNLLEKHGFSLDAGAFGIPRWAAIPGNRTNEDWRVWALGRPEQNVYEKFCERLAERYGKRIDYYEIGNEWDLGFKGTIDDAVEIQRMSYLGLKRGNPDVCVIPNGWAAPGDNPQVVRSGHAGFHEAFLRRAGKWFDVHPIHIHGGFADYAAQIEGKFFPLRERTGVSGKPWYSNETSMTSLWDERSVAYLVWKKVLWAWSRGSVDYIWYNLRGTGWDPKDPEQWYGLVSADYKPRDSYVAFAALSKTFGGKRFRREAFHLASRYVMEFAGENDITLGAWDETAGGLVAVRVGTDARKAWHVDVMGNRTSVPVENGHATFSFGAAPAALVLDGATFADLDMKALADIPPPKAKPVSIPADSPGRKPDFVMDSHGQVHDFYEANPAETGRLWKGPQDLSAKAWLSCCKKGLRLRVEVVDDVHSQSYPDGDQYMGDDVQVALASHLQQGHWEFGLARRDDGTPSVACWLGPAGFDASKAASRVELATKREGSITSYDACIPYEAVGFGPELPYQGFRFNLLVNDNDGDGRDAFIELKRGNFSTKDASAYPFVRISR